MEEQEELVTAGRRKNPKKKTLLETFREGWRRELEISGLSRADITDGMAARGFPGWDSSKISRFLSGKLGASLDACDALAACVGARIDDLLDLNQTYAQLKERADSEWDRAHTSLDSARSRLFDLIGARRGFTKAMTRMIYRLELDLDANRAQWGRVPSYPEFSLWWRLIEVVTKMQILTLSNGKRDLTRAVTDEYKEEVADAILRALDAEPDADALTRRAAVVRVLKAHQENALHVIVDEALHIEDVAEKRHALLKTLSAGTVAEKNDAERRLEALNAQNRTALRKMIQKLSDEDPTVRVARPAD